jgi:protein-tyrosine phosphatase
MMSYGVIDSCRDRRDGWPARSFPGFVDLHCHCLPGLDDGPASMGEAVALCRALVCDNIRAVVATPHQLGRFEGHTNVQAIRRATDQLTQHLRDEGLALSVSPGAEVRLDERMSVLLAEEAILTLADRGRHILVELPDAVFIDIEPLLIELLHEDVELIIAHAERNRPALDHPRALRRWLDYGAGLQVTATSLIGRFGSTAQQAAWRLIARGWVVVVATDAHGRGVDGPGMSVAFEMIAARFGEDLARLLCIENPSRALLGRSLAQVFA